MIVPPHSVVDLAASPSGRAGPGEPQSPAAPPCQRGRPLLTRAGPTQIKPYTNNTTTRRLYTLASGWTAQRRARPHGFPLHARAVRRGTRPATRRAGRAARRECPLPRPPVRDNEPPAPLSAAR